MMTKRIVSALLWFYSGWYGAAMLAHFTGAPELIGPVVGAALAAVIAGDPMHRIWVKPGPESETAVAPTAGAEQLA